MTDAGRHHIVLYDAGSGLQRVVADLAARAGPDDLFVLACRPQHVQALARVVARARPDLVPAVLLPRPDIHSRPVAALASRLRLVRHPARRPGGRVRLVAEPDPGTTPQDWSRAGQFEAACTPSIAPAPLDVVCAYHRASAPEQLLATVGRTHPWLVTAGGAVGNPAFRDPAVVLADLARRAARSAPTQSPLVRITGSTALRDLGGIRAVVAQVLGGLPTLVRTDFVAAVNEVLANAHQHGVAPVDVTVWVTAEQVECRVTDRGTGFTDALVGYLAAAGAGRSRIGLWLARQACDTLDAWRSADGFTVRLASSTAPAQVFRTEGALARAETARARVTDLGRPERRRLAGR